MEETFKITAQFTPSAPNTSENAYTVGAAFSGAVLSTLTICNQTASQMTFRLSVADSGEALATKQYIFYDTPIRANDTLASTIGMTLAVDDVVRFYASTASCSLNIFGTEIT